jgi:hypothetical protein
MAEEMEFLCVDDTAGPPLAALFLVVSVAPAPRVNGIGVPDTVLGRVGSRRALRRAVVGG